MRRMLRPMSVMMSMSGGIETTSAPCGDTKFETTPRIWSASAYESRMHLRDRLLVRGRARLRVGVERDRVLLRVRGADELVVPAGRVDRDVVRVERDEERGVRLVRGDRRLREQGDLPAGDVLRVDEVPARPAARLLEDVDDVRLVERQHEAALQRDALRVGAERLAGRAAAGRRRRGGGAGAARAAAPPAAARARRARSRGAGGDGPPGAAGARRAAERPARRGARAGARRPCGSGPDGCGAGAGERRGRLGEREGRDEDERGEQRSHSMSLRIRVHGPLMLYSLRITRPRAPARW